jgi:hypothetical protein
LKNDYKTKPVPIIVIKRRSVMTNIDTETKEEVLDCFPLWLFECPSCGEVGDNEIGDDDFEYREGDYYYASVSCEKCSKELKVRKKV